MGTDSSLLSSIDDKLIWEKEIENGNFISLKTP